MDFERKRKLPFSILLPANLLQNLGVPAVTEERKFAILFAATILAARKLIDMDPNKPNLGKDLLRGQGNRRRRFHSRTD
jgi:hypothetical protein